MKKTGTPWWLIAVISAVVAGVTGTYLWEQHKPTPSAPANTLAVPPVSDDAKPTQIEAATTSQTVVEEESAEPSLAATDPQLTEEPAQQAATPEPYFSFPLPSLAESDQPLIAVVAKQIGPKWAALLVDEALIERAVAAVDNLSRQALNPQQLPLKLPAGRYRVIEADGVLYPSNANIARYQPYVELLNHWQPEQWLAFYQHIYPLLQQAYANLGYPDSAFHDKLLSAIEQLLNAPAAPTAPQLEQPHVFYQYADSALEQASESDRFMMRLGPSTQHQLKIWLQQFQQQLQQWQPEASENAD